MHIDPRIRRFFNPVVRNAREYRLFVAKITLGAVFAALSFDVANQLLFAHTWEDAISSWIVTIAMAASISLVASIVIGQAYLELFEAKSAVDVLSRTDALTGLPNRRAFFETAANESAAMTLVIADVDRFKRVNDTRGHLVGDEVLRTVARMMDGALAPVGHVSRIGGEEFAVLATGVPLNALLTALDAFRRRLAATPVMLAGTAVEITISAGVAVRMRGMSFDDLYADADRALYEAKTSGRNRIRLAVSAQLALAGSAERAPWSPGNDERPARAMDRALSA